MENRDACIGAISAAIAEHETRPLMAALREHGVPFSRVNEYENLVEDGQLDALGVIESGRGDAYPEFRIPGLPFHLSEHDRGEPEDAPRIGEHTREVLAGIDYDPARIDRLLADDTVREA